jgi:uncharacterized membrane protein
VNWSVTETGLLYKLAESGELSPDELVRARAVALPAPSRDDWLRAMDRLCIFGGVALLGAALVFFLAWNWPHMHRFAKLGLVAGALVATVVTAGTVQPFGTVYRAALFGAAVCTGALLALVGQVYQTGADAWELFLAWTLLMLPFVMLARSSASWALWIIVANTALLGAIFQGAPWLAFLQHAHYGTAFEILFISGANLVLLLVFERAAAFLLLRPRRYVHQLAAIAMLGPLATGAAVGWWEDSFQPVLACFVVVAAAMIFYYYRLRRDLVLLALAAYAAIAVLTSGLLKLLPVESAAGFIWYNALAVFVVAASALTGKWIIDLNREREAP